MVDVGDKPLTNRQAVAEGTVRMSDEAFRALRDHRLSKGDALTAARFAGIQAAKRTSEWIPLCHPIPIHKIEVECRFGEAVPEVVKLMFHRTWPGSGDSATPSLPSSASRWGYWARSEPPALWPPYCTASTPWTHSPFPWPLWAWPEWRYRQFPC